MNKQEMREAILRPHHRKRSRYMALAREARDFARRGDNLDFGVIQFYRPVSYYVEKARRANRRIVENKIWRNM